MSSKYIYSFTVIKEYLNNKESVLEGYKLLAEYAIQNIVRDGELEKWLAKHDYNKSEEIENHETII
jgi:uncharacterized membrane-anchored protein